MSRDKYLKREIIHRLLDGDVSPDEKQAMMDQIESDPVLKEEYDGLAGALHAVKTEVRKPVPTYFTAGVMKKLPQRKRSFAQKMRVFFFRPRMLRWNVAAALATAGLVILVLTQVVRFQNRPGDTAAVTRQDQVVTVTMNFYAPEAHQVAVAGTFNKWKVDTDALKRQDNGVWTIDIPLKPGVYTYMFVVDGKAWVTDPNADAYRDDGFGYKNSVLRVRT